MVNQERDGQRIGLDESRFVGMMTEQTATHYLTSRQPGAPADIYANEGIVVIRPNSVMKDAIALIDRGVQDCISKGKLKGEDIVTLRHRKNERNYERRWASLFNVDKVDVDVYDERHKWRKKWMEWRTAHMGDAVAKIIFPDMYYAKEAYNRAEVELRGGPRAQEVTDAEGETLYLRPSDSAQKKIREVKILESKKANLLVRGTNLDSSQDMHADGRNFHLNVIHIMHCGDEGYHFRAIRGSNDLLGNEEVITKLEVPTGEIEDLRVDENDIIVFAASTLHSGGRTSGSKTYREGYKPDKPVKFGVLPTVPKTPKKEGGSESEEEESGSGRDSGGSRSEEEDVDFFRGYFGTSKKPHLLSDLSVQYTFEVTALPTTKYQGLDKPIWVKRGEGSSDHEVSCLSRVEYNPGAFSKELERGTERWLKMLAENKAPRVSRRA